MMNDSVLKPFEHISLKRPHPLILGAATAVLIFSVLGSAAIIGWLPNAHPEKETATEQAKDSLHQQDLAHPTAGKYYASAAVCMNCGTISAIHTVRLEGAATGLGAVAGGVTGALVGSQIGKGNGKTAMTIVGAAGGAYAGNEIEKNTKAHTVYRLTVRMDDGSYRTVSQSTNPAYAVGDKVRVVNGTLTKGA